jgi:hypothetical protein
MFIERINEMELLKRISRQEPYDPFTRINKKSLPILPIQTLNMLAYFEMNKNYIRHHIHQPLVSTLLSHCGWG